MCACDWLKYIFRYLGEKFHLCLPKATPIPAQVGDEDGGARKVGLILAWHNFKSDTTSMQKECYSNMARVSISSWLFPVEKCTDNKERGCYLPITRFLWAILYTLIFLSDLIQRFLKIDFYFFHAFAKSGNIAYFPVSFLISFSCVKGTFPRSSVSYNVQ